MKKKSRTKSQKTFLNKKYTQIPYLVHADDVPGRGRLALFDAAHLVGGER